MKKTSENSFFGRNELIVFVIIIVSFFILNQIIMNFEVLPYEEYKTNITKYATLLSSNKSLSISSGELAQGVRLSDNQMSAELLVIEFSDFECPYCYGMQSELEKVKSKTSSVNSKIDFVFRNAPQVEIHKNAYSAAIFYECIKAKIDGDVSFDASNKLTKLVLLKKQLFVAGASDLSDLALVKVGVNLGLEIGAVNSCLDDPASKNIVDSDIAFAKKIGVIGTPTFLLISPKHTQRSKIIEGAITADELGLEISQVLNNN